MLSSFGHPGNLPTQDVPMQVEDRLTAAGTDVDEHAIVLEAGAARRLGDEREHPPRLLRRELRDLAEGVDVPLGQYEQMRVGLRVDIADRHEAVGPGDVIAFPHELAEEAVVTRHRRRSPPPSPRARAPARARRSAP